MNPLVLIPSRLGSKRLPQKALADILGEPMIVHVWRRAIEADVGPVAVATDTAAIADAIMSVGGKTVMTRADHASGTDRIAEAISLLDPDANYDTVVNLQDDLPTIAPYVSRKTMALLDDPAVSIGTPVALITGAADGDEPSIVKMIGAPIGSGRFRALYFTRARAPWGEGDLYHHIGLYVWRRSAFNRLITLPPSSLEQREQLEQLRALQAGMRIDAVVVDDVPLSVDTHTDLEKVRQVMALWRTEATNGSTRHGNCVDAV